MRRILIVTVGLVLFAGLAVYRAQLEPQSVSYRMAAVERGNLKITVSANGIIKPVKTVQVGSQLSGEIVELLVDFNDKVKKGQPIARLDHRSFAAKVQAAESAVKVAKTAVKVNMAAIDRAKADLENARASRSVVEAQISSAEAVTTQTKQDLERKTSLFEKKTISESLVERARANYLSADALLRAQRAEKAVKGALVLRAKAGLQLAKEELLNVTAAVAGKNALLDQALIDLERTTIRAPIDGIIISRDVDRGQTVAASLEAPKLFVIAQDLRQMEVHAKVDEADIGRVQEGQPVNFTVESYPGRNFIGKVIQIRKSPAVIQNVVIYTVVITAENQDLALLPGMTAFATIVIQTKSDILKIPNTALRFRPPEEAAIVTDGGTKRDDEGRMMAVVWMLQEAEKLVPVHIDVGESHATSTEVVSSGLTEGQKIVIGTIARHKRWSFLGWQIGF